MFIQILAKYVDAKFYDNQLRRVTVIVDRQMGGRRTDEMPNVQVKTKTTLRSVNYFI